MMMKDSPEVDERDNISFIMTKWITSGNGTKVLIIFVRFVAWL
jgi:hypothetical protein